MKEDPTHVKIVSMSVTMLAFLGLWLRVVVGLVDVVITNGFLPLISCIALIGVVGRSVLAAKKIRSLRRLAVPFVTFSLVTVRFGRHVIEAIPTGSNDLLSHCSWMNLDVFNTQDTTSSSRAVPTRTALRVQSPALP